jgi:LysR family transcriptional regulator, glycine cleavage system transcriptional activator
MAQDDLSLTAGRKDGPAGLTSQQRQNMPPFGAIRAFEAVGSFGGIRRAAQALSADHAAISRHVRALESWTGMELVNRAPGTGGGLTPLGLRYHERISAGLAEIASAGIELTRRDNQGLQIWCTPGLASEWLTKRISAFTEAIRLVELQLIPSELSPNLAAHEADAHLHYLKSTQTPPEMDHALRTVEIARPATEAVASPRYLAAHPAATTPAALLTMQLLHEGSCEQWERWFAAHGLIPHVPIGGPRLGGGNMTLAAARCGQGIALANSLLIEDDLASGNLVRIGNWKPVHLGSYFFTARRDRWRDPVIASSRRWLETSLPANL